jgi:hypothetical protein
MTSPLLQHPGLQDRVKKTVEYQWQFLVNWCNVVLTIDFGLSPHASKIL